jgi:predicted aspartyl protease
MLGLLPLALAAVRPQTPATVVLAPDSESRWVPFARSPTNQLVFDLTLDGRSARGILDTGLSHTLVTSGFAQAARLRPARSQQASAIGGTVAIGWAPVATLAFGGVTRRGGQVGILKGGEQERLGVDVLIGSDLLSCCALEIDPDRGRFRLLRSGRMPFTGTAVPLARNRAGLYLAEARFNGVRLRPMIVDTGDGAAVTFSRAAWLSTGYHAERITTTLGWGAGGPVVTDTLIAPGFAIGSAAPVEAEIRIEPEGGFSASIGAAGRIGAALLARYHLLLDPQAGRMVLSPGAQASDPVLRSTSGLLLAYAGRVLRVLHVMRGSPAAQAGLRDGDAICAADGAATEGPVGWTAGTPGRTVRLELCDGRTRTITLRRFY